MKKILVVLISSLFLLGVLFFSGCGPGAKTHKVTSAADEESEVMEEAKAAAKASRPSTYIVEEGDTLWSIAAKPKIYGDKYLWPLIYDANRDIIDSYNSKLQEGQKLIIPRNVSAVEIEAAKERAKELGVPDSGRKMKVASTRKIKDYEDAQNRKVVALSGKKQAVKESYEEETETEEEPTPIPEPVKSKKKGKINIVPLFLIILGVILLIIFFIFSRQKKEEEGDEDREGGRKTNIIE